MLRFPLLLLACLMLSSCFLKPYKIDVMQGNYIDDELIAMLKQDMTRSQVRFLMGTPLITDPFHPERWDYLYIDRRAGKLKEVRRLTLYFEDDKLKRALTDTPVDMAKPQAAAVTPASPNAQPAGPGQPVPFPPPATAGQPAVSGQAVPPAESATSGQPAGLDQPDPSAESAASREPAASGESDPFAEPASGQPAGLDQPDPSAEPAASHEPAASGQPDPFAEPAASREPAPSDLPAEGDSLQGASDR
jgi:outer membrane protein assembly factor BamE